MMILLITFMIFRRSSVVIPVAIVVVVLLTVYFASHKSDINKYAFAQGVNNNSSHTLINLNGKWTDQANHSAIISQSATNLTIDMSASKRPSAYGSILNDSAIAVIFPDDESFNGKLVPPDKIKWSDGSIWTKTSN